MARKSFRDFVGDLDGAGELRHIGKGVDPRQFSGLLAQAPEALLFESIIGYPDWRLIGSVISTRKRLALAMGCPENAIALRLEEALSKLKEPEFVDEGACQEVIHDGDDVDLTAIPYPLMHLLDGGPYISATFVVSKDAEYGPNVGSYRMMYRTPRETGIDLVSPSDMRFYYQRMLDQGKALEIAVAIGVHPCDMLAAAFKAPIRNSEFAIAGGLHGAPVPLVKCKTVDLEVPADAEVVLEGELLPIGWTADEGPFGEFNRITGNTKWNPIFRVNCITHRRDPIFHLLRMPMESDWLTAPATEAAGLQALRVASVEPVDICAPVGMCAYWGLIASIRKRPGEGKNALLALLSVAEVKFAIVTDEDINIHDPEEVDWALALRVQPDKDVVIVSGVRGKHVDPSVRAWELSKGSLPTTAKMGIDATIPEGIPKKLYRRTEYYGKDREKLEDFI